ncbi:tRNA-binding protein [Candidatus Amesbacteria bacterium RIFCSPLOWO2_02_FULL_48_11]|nr:MAG: tRNA-binding protein [Candidatus Amesbacteria bacterium RIFCSPLOWO2_02_FULL_48_11]
MATIDDFHQLDIRVGKIIAVDNFPEAKKPSYKLTVNFGPEIGDRLSAAQLTKYYSKEELIGKLTLGVVNLPPRQIGPFQSQVLTLGVPDADGDCILVVPDKPDAVIGGRLY